MYISFFVHLFGFWYYRVICYPILITKGIATCVLNAVCFLVLVKEL